MLRQRMPPAEPSAAIGECPSIDTASDEQSDAATRNTTAFNLQIRERGKRELALMLAEVAAWTLSSLRYDLPSISR